ncbi:MAG TPA: hypothetical protein VEX86_19700 [Longimicrobium sp.]|nr:hypothetical protein [Longimicrobium sp.]
MRLSPSVSTLAAALAVLVLPAALAAQSAGSTSSAPRPPGCRGTTVENSSLTLSRPNADPVEFPSYAVIETVQPGSPAELGGMKRDDIIVVQNGRDLVGSPPAQPPLAGDTVQYIVRRNDVEVPVTVVLGYWDPPQQAPGVTRVCRRMGSAPTGG